MEWRGEAENYYEIERRSIDLAVSCASGSRRILWLFFTTLLLVLLLLLLLFSSPQ